jgi:hypothetical protein
MPYENSTRPSSSLGGMILFLFLVMIGIAAAIVSIGAVGGPDRQGKVLVPVSGQAISLAK